jgi:hypothetical protein
MSWLTIIGWFLAFIGIVLLITDSMGFTHLNYGWVMLIMISGFGIAFIGQNIE